GILKDVGDVNHLPGQDGARRGASVARRHRVLADDRRVEPDVAQGGHVDQLAVESKDTRDTRVTQPPGMLGDRVEHALDIRGGAGNDSEDLTRRRLLIQGLAYLGVGLGECVVLLLELGEQPHVLDGDDGLVGKGLEECDLLVGKRKRLFSTKQDHTQGGPFTKERDAEDRAMPVFSTIGAGVRKLVSGSMHILHVHRAALKDRAPADGARNERNYRPDGGWDWAVVGHDFQTVGLTPLNGRVDCTAKARRALNNRRKNWLEIGRRPADRPK